MVRINGERLLDDLRTLREFGRVGPGVVRQALSDVDIESRHWLVERMGEAGLDARIDGLGTVIGRSRGTGKALLVDGVNVSLVLAQGARRVAALQLLKARVRFLKALLLARRQF